MVDASAPANTTLISATGLPERPDFSQFRFKSIGQAPALFSRLGTPKPGSTYRSPSPAVSSNMDVSSDDIFDPIPSATIPGARRSLFQTLAGEGQRDGDNSPASDTRLPDQVDKSTSSGSRPSDTSGLFQTNVTTANESGAALLSQSHVSIPLETNPSTVLVTPMRDGHDENPHALTSSPLSLIAHLSDIVQERAEIQKIRDLLQQFVEEREEFGRRSEEAIRSLQRSTQQAQRVMSISEDAFNKTDTFIAKQETRLEVKKKQVEAKILARKDVEKRDTLRRQVQDMKQQDETRREADEEKRRKEEDVRSSQEDETRRLKEDEQRQLVEERRQQEEEAGRQKLRFLEARQIEQEHLEVEERSKREQLEKEELARKQEEEIKVKLAEKRKKLEEERIRKEDEERQEATKHAEEEARKRLYEEKLAEALARKYGTLQNSTDNNDDSRDGSAPLLPSPPASSSSSQKYPSPENALSFDQRHTRDAQAKKLASAANLHSVFVPAVTEAGRLISADQPPPTLKVEDPPLKLSRVAKSKAAKAKQVTQLTIKKEPLSPVVPPPQQLKTDSDADSIPPAISPLPMQAPPRFGPKPRGTGPSRRQAAKIAASLRTPSDLPRRPSATEWVPRPVRAPSPVRPQSPRSPVTPPRPWVSRPLTRSPSPTSPSPYSRRSRSPVSRARRNDHYSPENRRSPEGSYRPRLDYTRRDPSPQPFQAQPFQGSRKRAREHDLWPPSEDLRIEIPSKRRAVYDHNASRTSPRSPPSPRRRQPIQERFSAPEVQPSFTYPSNRRSNANPPSTSTSRWTEGPAASGDTTPLIERMSDQRSPPVPRGPNRKVTRSLEQRLTSR